MILNPKPKPIRYRISSGGVEHSSLDSLRRHFRWNEVKELIQEERIQKWLRKINKDSIAESIEQAPKENVPEWSVAAIFFGLESSVDGWLSLVKYWYDQGFEETISLNKDQWANNDLELEQLKRLRLPVSLIEEMADYQYKHLPPERTKKALKRIAEMGSAEAKQMLIELQEEERIEKARKKEEAAREAARIALELSRRSLDDLKKDWKKKESIKDQIYDRQLQPIVSFLVRLQELLSFTKTPTIALSFSMNAIEKEAVNSPIKDYYCCVLIATYRFLDWSIAKNVIDTIKNKNHNGELGIVSAEFEKQHFDFTKIYAISASLVESPHLHVMLMNWNNLVDFPKSSLGFGTSPVHQYNYYSSFINNIGTDLLNRYNSVL